jgi:hypothetical protein
MTYPDQGWPPGPADAPLSRNGAAMYRKKPIAVEAVQWHPDPLFARWEDGRYTNRRVGMDRHSVEYTVTEVGLRTKEGFMRIKPGDWVITGVEGERYACDAGIFAKTYELASTLSERGTTDDREYKAWNNAIKAAVMILRQNANACSNPSSPAAEQNWPFVLETMAREIDKLQRTDAPLTETEEKT